MLSEVVFQGIYGSSGPVKFGSKESYSEFMLPDSMHVEDVQAILTALFFPSRLTDAERRAVEFGQQVKMAATFEAANRSWRILRRDTDETLRLQMREDGGFKDVARGDKVELMLQERLRLAPFPLFSVLAFWRFEEPIPPDAEAFSIDALSQTARDIVFKYRLALDIEKIEDRVSSLEHQADSARERLGEGARLADKLEKARAKYDEIAIPELSAEDLSLLGERDERLGEFEHQVRRLQSEEEETREEVHISLPDKPWKNQIFWAGIVLSVGALIVSVIMRDTLRPIAAANVLGLGLSAWIVLRYFTDLERASIHVMRLDSIKRRLNQVREEQVSFKDKINHLLIHAGVENEDELTERFEKSSRLKEIIGRMDAQLSKIELKPVYQTARRELDVIEEDLAQVRAERAAAGQNTLSAFQLETDLKKLGLDPGTVIAALEERDKKPERQQEPYDRDPFTRLAEIAERCGLMSARGLDDRVLQMWTKICAHVLGPRFKDLSLSPEGEVQVSSLTREQLAMWSQTRPREVRMIAMGLSAAISVNMPSQFGSLNLILVDDPVEMLSSEHATKFREVLLSASKKAQVILCT